MAVTTRDRQLAMKSLRWFMDPFLFSFGGDAVSNFQFMLGGDPA
jgi:hypothetical protein